MARFRLLALALALMVGVTLACDDKPPEPVPLPFPLTTPTPRPLLGLEPGLLGAPGSPTVHAVPFQLRGVTDPVLPNTSEVTGLDAALADLVQIGNLNDVQIASSSTLTRTLTAQASDDRPLMLHFIAAVTNSGTTYGPGTIAWVPPNSMNINVLFVLPTGGSGGGANWSIGSAAPSGGSNGDWYLRTGATLPGIYNRTSGTWGLVMAAGTGAATDSVARAAAAAAQTTANAALPRAGGTMTGALTLSGAPTANLHAATKAYVDTNAGGEGVSVGDRVESIAGTADTGDSASASRDDHVHNLELPAGGPLSFNNSEQLIFNIANTAILENWNYSTLSHSITQQFVPSRFIPQLPLVIYQPNGLMGIPSTASLSGINLVVELEPEAFALSRVAQDADASDRDIRFFTTDASGTGNQVHTVENWAYTPNRQVFVLNVSAGEYARATTIGNVYRFQAQVYIQNGASGQPLWFDLPINSAFVGSHATNIPDSPPFQSTVRQYKLQTPATSGSTAWIEDTSELVQSFAPLGVINWDTNNGRIANITLQRNTTLTISGGKEGHYAILHVTQDATGGRTLDITGVNLGAFTSAPPIASAAGARTSIVFWLINGRWTYFYIEPAPSSGGAGASEGAEGFTAVFIPSGANNIQFGIEGESGFSTAGTVRPNGKLVSTNYLFDYRDSDKKAFVVDQGSGDVNVQLADLSYIATVGARDTFGISNFRVVNNRSSGNITFLRAGGIADVIPAGSIVEPGYSADIFFFPHGSTRYLMNISSWGSDDTGISQSAADARYLRLSGGTLTGALTLSGAPTANLHAATKAYVDSNAGGTLTLAQQLGMLQWTADPTTVKFHGNGLQAALTRSFAIRFTNPEVVPTDTWYTTTVETQNESARQKFQTVGTVRTITVTLDSATAGRVAGGLSADSDLTIQLQFYDAATGGNRVGVITAEIGVVGVDAGSPRIRGAYANNTAYEAGDIVTHGGETWWVSARVAGTNTSAPGVNSHFRLLTAPAPRVLQAAVNGSDTAGVTLVTLPTNYTDWQTLRVVLWRTSDNRIYSLDFATAAFAAQTATRLLTQYGSFNPTTRVYGDSNGHRIIYAELN